MKKVKVTKEQFEYFKSRCEYWIDKLGLYEWHVYILLEAEEKTVVSSVTKNIPAMIITIRLNTKLDSCDVTKENLNKIALEEVAHAMMSNMTFYAKESYSDSLVNEAEHAIINHLKKALIKKNDK